MSINFFLMGERIKECRSRLQLQQDALAWTAEISVSYLSCIENGLKKPSLKSIIRISDALGVTIDYLLFGELNYGGHDDFHELYTILCSCEETEQRIIMEVVMGAALAVKRGLRDNRML